ncbi:hypothetical protein ACFYNN_33225 [Streptomyces sp. NPDC006978]|nr:hypothetical protein [Streptomyces sp. S584]
MQATSPGIVCITNNSRSDWQCKPPARAVPLARIAEAWSQETGERMVFVP